MENVGLSVYEGVSSGATGFRTPSKRNIGLIIEAERGVENVPQRIISPAAALEIFGQVNANMYGALVLSDMFVNAAPYIPVVYVSRIIGPLCVAATKAQTVLGVAFEATAAYLGKVDKGSWGNAVSLELNTPGAGAISQTQYTLTVKYKNRPVEQFQSPTCAALQMLVNEQSKFSVVTFASEPVAPAANSTIVVQLANGVYDEPQEADYTPNPDPVTPTGLSVFDGYDVQLLSCTELSSLSSAQMLSTYCTARGDAHAVVVLPFRATTTTAQNFAAGLQVNGRSHISVYDHWRRVATSTGSAWIPGMGFVLGAGFTRTPALQGDYIHIPPAGVDSASIGAIECAPARRGQTDLNYYTRELTINSVVFVKGTGYYIATSRTMSTNSLYQSIHTGLQASYYVSAIDSNLLFATQKPNSPELARQIYVALRTFFKGEYAVGALEGSLTFEKAAIITVSAVNPLDRTTRISTVDYIPTEATEAVRINVNRNDGSLNATTSDN